MSIKLKHIFRRICSRKKVEPAATYLLRFECVDKLLDGGLMAIDLAQSFVMLDASIHIMYMNDDRSYAAFMDTIRAYINYHRGEIKLPMIAHEDRINFIVILKEVIRFDESTGEVFQTAKEIPHPLIVGFYQNGRIDYTAYKDSERNTD